MTEKKPTQINSSDEPQQSAKRDGFATWIDFLATGGYAGYSKIVPGTCGTAVAVILAAMVESAAPGFLSGVRGTALVIFIACASVWVTDQALKLRLYGEDAEDPQRVVIDEVAGYFVTILWHPWSWETAFVAFLLFRFFDMTKFYPVNEAEKLPGAQGIVADDLVAGVYASVVLFIVASFGWL